MIGRVDVLDDKGKPLWSPDAIDWLRYRLAIRLKIADEGGNTYWIPGVDRGGVTDFYVTLPPGRYRITELSTFDLHAKLPGTFDVPTDPVVYIGTLRFVGRDGSFAERMVGRYASGGWMIVDTGSSVVDRFRQRYPRATEPVVSSLMRLGATRGH